MILSPRLLLPAALGLALSAGAPVDPKVKRGAYLVALGGCNDCHTPLKMGPKGPEPDGTRLLSGHPEGVGMPPAPKLPPGPWLWLGAATNTAFAGPWGVTFSSNLTPDPETGLKATDAATFIQWIRSGRHLGKGRPLLPPMPIQNLQAATDEDLRALHAYLRSLPPLKNRVPNHVPSAPVAP